MKKIILILASVVIVALLGVCFYSKEYIITGFRDGASGQVTKPQCYDKGNYFVVTRDEYESVGSDVLIKYKKNSDQEFPCLYVIQKGDFEVKNTDADYYNALINHYLVMDSGTSPGKRGLFIYDLNTRVKVYNSTKVGLVSDIDKNMVTYYEALNEEPTPQNCPKLDEYYQTVGNAVIVQKTTLTLGDTVKKEIVGGKECKGVN